MQFIYNEVSKKMLYQLLVPLIYEGVNKSRRAGWIGKSSRVSFGLAVRKHLLNRKPMLKPFPEGDWFCCCRLREDERVNDEYEFVFSICLIVMLLSYNFWTLKFDSLLTL